MAIRPLLFLLQAILTSSALASQCKKCRTVPTDPDWPQLSDWNQLNSAISGRLIQASAPAAVCHQNQPSYNETRCAEVKAQWPDEYFHANDPVSVEWNNWTNDTCLPDSTLTCDPAGYAAYVVNATTPEHVKAGIDFARKHNIRVIVKSSGHDYVGRSTAPYALSIWTRYMNEISLRPNGFSPKGCNITIPDTAMTAGAGTQMREAYQAADTVNRTIVGGNGRSVALGGFITGGGHSTLAPTYGLAADLVLEMELVTPKGEILTVNECQNTDLFWAMRGGGGGTFGVLTSVTTSLVPNPAVTKLGWVILTSASDPRAFDMIAYVVSQFPRLSRAGIRGYPVIINSKPNFLTGGSDLVTGLAAGSLMLDTNLTTMQSILGPVFDHVNRTWPGMVIGSTPAEYPSYLKWYEANYDKSPVGLNKVVASRLLDEEALTGNMTRLKEALIGYSTGASESAVFMVSGEGVHKAVPRGGGNAVVSAWRKAFVHATTVINFPPQNETAKQEAISKVNGFAAHLKALAPDSGAYMNEASRYETQWQKDYWGDNYARLARIKKEVDPDDVLWCFPCVGSEGWREVGKKLCRV